MTKAEDFLKEFVCAYQEDSSELTICVEVKLYNPYKKEEIVYSLPLKVRMENECFVDGGADEYVFNIGSVDVLSIESNFEDEARDEGLIKND